MQRVVALDKTDARIWTALGDAYKTRGNYQSAIKAFKEAIELESDNDIAQIQVRRNFFHINKSFYSFILSGFQNLFRI